MKTFLSNIIMSWGILFHLLIHFAFIGFWMSISLSQTIIVAAFELSNWWNLFALITIPLAATIALYGYENWKLLRIEL